MKTFKQFILSKNENNSNFAINESIVVPRILMQKIGDIARPVFQKIADDIDNQVSIGKYAEKFLASDFLSMIGIELGNPYFKTIEIEIKNLKIIMKKLYNYYIYTKNNLSKDNFIIIYALRKDLINKRII